MRLLVTGGAADICDAAETCNMAAETDDTPEKRGRAVPATTAAAAR